MKSSQRKRFVAALISLCLLPLSVVISAGTAGAAGTNFFSQTFTNSALTGSATSVYKPTVPSYSNAACLTASSNTSASPLPGCSGSAEADGSGALRLTNSVNGSVGGLFVQSTVPTANGLDLTFDTYQYGQTSMSPADGLSFAIAAVDPANPTPPANIGGCCGALGYAAENSTAPGLDHGYLGFGLDVYGNFSNTNWNGSGCSASPYIGGTVPSQVVVRGPGNANAGYCALASSATNTSSPPLALSGGASGTRSGSRVPVHVLINPSGSTVTSGSLSAAAASYAIAYTPIGGSEQTLTGALPDATGFAPGGWLDGSGVPKQLAFGWAASTGGSNEKHEIANVVVNSVTPAPLLGVTQSFVGSTSAGTANTFTITPSIQAGTDENKAVSISETFPSGVTPTAASGTGWTCSITGQDLGCTTTATSFTAGTTLAAISVTATVTTTTATALQGSTVRVFSDDTTAVYATTSLPAAPSASALTSSGVGRAAQAASATIPTGGSAALIDGSTPVTTLTTAQGAYTINASTGAIGYVAAVGFSGAATAVTYRVTDAYARTASSTYVPTVTKPAAPVADAKTATKLGAPGPVSTTITIPDNGSITLLNGSTPTTTVTLAGIGTYSVNTGTGVITFTPVANFSGSATPVTYRVTDAYSQSASSTFTAVMTTPTVGGTTSATPTGDGYWTIDPQGGVGTHGDATSAGSMAGKSLAAPVVGISSTANGDGYWLAASDGGVFSFGTAPFKGSMGGTKLNAPVVAIAGTSDSNGYWMTASDGGVFAFGNAGYFGNTLALKLNKPVVTITPTSTSKGYWLTARDGGVFAFGDAVFYGNTLSLNLNQPIVGLAPTASGRGYWMVAADGGVFAFGDARFYGSDGGKSQTLKTVGIVASPTGNGYSLIKSDTSVVNFGDASLTK